VFGTKLSQDLDSDLIWSRDILTMETEYLANFNSFHDEFLIFRDEVLHSLAERSKSARPDVMEMPNSLGVLSSQPGSMPEFQRRGFQNYPSNKLHKQVLIEGIGTSMSIMFAASGQDKLACVTDSSSKNGRKTAPYPITTTSLGPRKGHKKSRRGCFNCKKRKIKV
jgi:hypothetical protein